MSHHYRQDEAASRKSSLDTLETFRADNTTAGTSFRQQQMHYNGEYTSNFDYADADDGGQNPYMFEPYEEQVEDFAKTDCYPGRRCSIYAWPEQNE